MRILTMTKWALLQLEEMVPIFLMKRMSDAEDDFEDDVIDEYLDKVQNSGSIRKMKHKGSPDNVCVKPRV